MRTHTHHPKAPEPGLYSSTWGRSADGRPFKAAARVRIPLGIPVLWVVGIGFLAIGFPAAEFAFGFSPSYGSLAATFGIVLTITVAATVLPTLSALGKAEPKEIARLMAE